MISTIKKLSHILTRREKFQILLLLLLIVLMAFFQALGVGSIIPFIGLVMEPELVNENEWLNLAYNMFNFGDVQTFVIATGIAMFTVILLSNGISALATYAKIKFAWMNNQRLATRLLEKYLSMPYTYFLNQHSADLTKNVLSEVYHLTNSFLIPLLMFISKAILVLFILAMLLWVDVVVTLVAVFVLGGCFALIYINVHKNLRKRGALRMKTNKMRYKIVGEAFGGIKEIKVMRREYFFVRKFITATKENVGHLTWKAVIGELPKFALEAIAFGGIIVFILVLLVTEKGVHQVIPLTALFAFAGYRIMPAFQEIFKCFSQMQFNKAVLNRVYYDITKGDTTISPQILTKRELPEPLPFNREIQLQGITYSYPNTDSPVIADLDLVIHRNTSVALVGLTGAGKTTLADIILGLLAPQAGLLLIDGVPVDARNLLQWQQNIGYVPQHIFLSDDTVYRNIAFGLPDKQINKDAVEKAARVANIHDFVVNELPDGYGTLIGERGIRLSGGQRQRIGIARAMYHDPEVLVFDEATSALDGTTEEAVLHAMENAARFKTLIIIAHRLTTVKNCDAVYLIDKGRIVDSGTYDYLLQNNKQFRSMARMKT